MSYNLLMLPVTSLTSGLNNDDVVFGSMPLSNITSATYITNYRFVEQAITVDTATGTQNFTDVTTSVARSTGTGFTVSGSAAALTSGDAIYIRTVNNAAFSKIFARVATPGAGTWDIRIQRFNQQTDTWETMTVSSDSTNGFRVAGSGTITFTSSVNGVERLRTGDPKYAWTKIEFTGVSGVTASPKIDRIRVRFDKTSFLDVTEPYRDGTWPGVQSVFNEQANEVFLVLAFPTPPVGMRATITTADTPYATMAFEYYASNNTWKSLVPSRDPSNLLANTGTHEIRWVHPSDWLNKTVTYDDIDDGATATSSITGHLLRIRRATAPVSHVYYDLGQMRFQAKALGGTSAGMPVRQAMTIQYATYEIGNNRSTTDVSFAVCNNSGDAVGSFTIPARRHSSMLDPSHKLTLSTPVTFADGEEMLLMQLSGDALTDVRLFLHY